MKKIKLIFKNFALAVIDTAVSQQHLIIIIILVDESANDGFISSLGD
jgi:hypothetical protein